MESLSNKAEQLRKDRVMSTNNPFRKHTSSMFASRGCDIDEAIVYANDVITALPTESQAGAMTALMVVVNTDRKSTRLNSSHRT